MPLDEARPPCERQHLVIGQAEALPFLGGRGLAARGATAVRVHQPDLLGAQPAADDRLRAFQQRGLEDDPLVRGHDTLDHVLAEPVRARHDDGVAKARFGVQREDDARAGDVRPDHRHDAHRQRDSQVVVAEPRAVTDRAVGEERRTAGVDGAQHALGTTHVEERLGGAGERGFGQVFGSGRRAHRERGLAAQALVEPFARFEHGLTHGRRKWRLEDRGTRVVSAARELLEILGVEAGEQRAQAIAETRFGEQEAERLGRGREPVDHANSLRPQGTEQLTQRRVLASDLSEMIERDLREVEREGFLAFHGVLPLCTATRNLARPMPTFPHRR